MEVEIGETPSKEDEENPIWNKSLPSIKRPLADFASGNVALQIEVGKMGFVSFGADYGTAKVLLSKLGPSGKEVTTAIGGGSTVTYKVESVGIEAIKTHQSEKTKREQDHNQEMEDERKANADAIEERKKGKEKR